MKANIGHHARGDRDVFRLFLQHKLLEGAWNEAVSRRDRESEPRENRRSDPRYTLDHKHLTLMSEQDIFQVQDLSSSGMACCVSARTLERLRIGDLYAGRFRHGDTSHALEIRVSWTGPGIVGFEIMHAKAETRRILERLIEPLAIAKSLRRVDEDTPAPTVPGERLWYHGERESDLYLWFDTQHQLRAWQLVVGRSVVDWKDERGFSTGSLQSVGREQPLAQVASGYRVTLDSSNNVEAIQRASDVIAALAIQERDDLLNTLNRSA